ncbi:MAG: 50S ribosomal protein L3 [Patescibacteria group bacterium]|nr:50S ribosomal protein L3 [Patescibacteria group bacterium]
MFILAKKLNMTQVWNDKDEMLAVTRVKCLGCKVLDLKTRDKHGYAAAVIGNEDFKREWRDSGEGFKKDLEIGADQFSPGDQVKVIGKSKGKGFQGVVKRHGFSGGDSTHGHRHDSRRSGSIGSAFPEHVMKGKKMAGRMGGERVTVANLKIQQVDAGQAEILLAGAVPGKAGDLLIIKKIDTK